MYRNTSRGITITEENTSTLDSSAFVFDQIAIRRVAEGLEATTINLNNATEGINPVLRLSPVTEELPLQPVRASQVAQVSQPPQISPGLEEFMGRERVVREDMQDVTTPTQATQGASVRSTTLGTTEFRANTYINTEHDYTGVGEQIADLATHVNQNIVPHHTRLGDAIEQHYLARMRGESLLDWAHYAYEHFLQYPYGVIWAVGVGLLAAGIMTGILRYFRAGHTANTNTGAGITRAVPHTLREHLARGFWDWVKEKTK